MGLTKKKKKEDILDSAAFERLKDRRQRDLVIAYDDASLLIFNSPIDKKTVKKL